MENTCEHLIFYFSGTGNSIHVAREIAKHLENCRLIPLLNISGDIPDRDNLQTVGIVYPVHMNALPKPVKKFLKEVQLPCNAFVYVVATNGGYHGKAGGYLLQFLKKTKLEINAYFPVKMINNTPKGVAPKMFMSLDWEEHIGPGDMEKMSEGTGVIIPEIVRAIVDKDGSSLKIQQDEARGFSFCCMKMVWKLSEWIPPSLEYILNEHCTGCGTCKRVCTSGTITMQEKKPLWQKDVECNFCYACFNFCPEQAIVVKHYEKRLGRYSHPSIDWTDIEKQKGESAG